MDPVSNTTPRVSIRRKANIIALVLCVLGLGLVGWLVWREAGASSHWSAANEALAAGDIDTARKELAHCLEAWPDDAEVHFLAARTARRDREYGDAEKLLARAEGLGWVREAVSLEQALLKVQRAGRMLGYEEYFVKCIDGGHPDAILILEAIVPVLYSNFHLNQADRLSRVWTDKAPGSFDAWFFRGRVLERRASVRGASECFAEAVKLRPDHIEARLGLGRTLLESNQPTPALEVYNALRAREPLNREILLGLAGCYRTLGRTKEARSTLDDLLARHPEDGRVLTERARVETIAGDHPAAEKWFREALEHPPFPPRFWLFFAITLAQNDKPEEAAKIRKRHEQAEADLALLEQVCDRIAAEPADLGARVTAGEILLRNHHEAAGLGWIDSALVIEPRYAPAHKALADYFEERNPERAEMHRRLAGSTE